ncbi:EAL domain-containing protein [Azoarcus sp. L1K30]|nr:EAL domain-containing protein [Azoarcus sp. L1K30]
MTIAAVRDGEGRLQHYIGDIADITRDREAEEKLHLAASVFTHALEAIMITAPDGTIIDVNQAFCRTTGFSADEVIGKNPRILKSGLQPAEFYAAMWQTLLSEGQWSGEVWNRRKTGEVYAEMQTISAVRDAEGRVLRYVSLFSDISRLKEHEARLEHIAHYDALTALPNRVLLADRLQQAMAQTQRRRKRLAVAYLDLDGFKSINDRHGHDVGDQLLMTVAARMRQALREGDTLARLGGDEFVAVLADIDALQDSVVLITRLLSAAAQPVHTGKLLIQVSASVGVTFYPQPEPVDADQLLRQADQSMYQAKLSGKNCYHLFDAEHDRTVRGHYESVERIRQALNEREFVMHYQPKVNMRSGEIVGTEALLRWQHPDKGLILPGAFLPVIENHPLSVELGHWVIDTTLTQMEAWHALGLELHASINVGARQLRDPGFVDALRNILAAHPLISPAYVELEVLETSALEDLAGVAQVIKACGEIGVKFSLDDFGTGYSSLTYLKHLPVTQLKIDQSFVRDILIDPDDLAIVDSVLGLAAAFRRGVIAEGVESAEHGEILLQLGCELAQGYGIARPMPADLIPQWCKTWQPDPKWRMRTQVKRAERPLIFAAAEHRAWINSLEHYLRGKRKTPPALDCHECALGHWLDSGGLSHRDGEPALTRLHAIHQQVHQLGAELCAWHEQQQGAEACDRMGELIVLRNALLEQLDQLA